MDQMTVNPNYGSINGTYYSGPVKQYLMTLPDSEPVGASRNLVWTSANPVSVVTDLARGVARL